MINCKVGENIEIKTWQRVVANSGIITSRNSNVAYIPAITVCIQDASERIYTVSIDIQHLLLTNNESFLMTDDSILELVGI